MPLFEDRGNPPCRIIEWHKAGKFARETQVLNEALSCASFLGYTGVVAYVLAQGVDPVAGSNTGLNGFREKISSR